MPPLRDNVNAFCAHGRTPRQDSSSGPLAGVTFGVKDLFDVAGIPSGCGQPDWLRTHQVPTRDAPIVAALLAAGARYRGKTQMDELAWSLNGRNAHYGTPVNVAAPGRIPGGSSSGSAAATAAGLVDFALGSDTGGSVRVPASFCGLYGIRVSHGAVPLAGAMPFAPSFDAAGWFARDPGLLRRVGDVLLPPDRAPPPRRLLLAEDLFALLAPGPRAALAPVLARLVAPLGPPTEVTVAGSKIGAWRDAFRVLQGAEIWRTLGPWVEATRPAFGPGIAERFSSAPSITVSEVAAADQQRAAIKTRLHALLADGAVLLLPTAPDIAPPRDMPDQALEQFRAAALALLCPAGHAGLPQLSLPLATRDACPLGLSLLGAPGSDRALLALAAAL